MKKNIKISVLFFLFILLSAGNLYADRDVKILEDISHLEKLYPCEENSENEKQIYSYIERRLDSLEINYYRESLDLLPDIHSFSSNIISHFEGKKEKSIIFAVPVNNLSDSSLNISLALSLAEELKNNPSELNCMIIFLGAEYTNDSDPGYPIGSRQFLNTYFPEEDTALIYLDLSSDSDIDIIHGSKELVTPLWLLQQIIESLTESGSAYKINTQENILYQLGYDTPTPADIYLNNNIPSISLLSAEHKTDDRGRLERIGSFRKFLSLMAKETEIQSADKWDRHYFMMNVSGKQIIISEYKFIILYITITGLMTAFSVITGKKVIRYSAKLIRYIWVFFYFFALIFLFLLLSTFITLLITQIKSSYDIWAETPFYLLSMKITITILLFFLSLFLLKKIKLPVSGSFYSAAAIFIFLLNFIIFQFINITVALFVLWGLSWTILFSLFKNRILKTACMFMSSVFFIYILVYVFQKPAYNICENILFNKFWGNILTSFVILPYIMMIIRLLISRTHIESAKYSALRRTIYSAAALVFIFLLNYYMKSNPYSMDNIQPVFYSQITDMDRKTSEIKIESPYKTEYVSFFTGENEYNINTDETQYDIYEETGMDLINIKKETALFLDRKNLILRIEASGKPEKYYIDFFAKEDPVVLDCNYPFNIVNNSRKGSIYIGKNPPSPLVIDMLIPENTSLWFKIRTVSQHFPFENNLKGENKNFIQKFEILKGTDG